MFWKRKKSEHREYDASVCKPVLKCSICTGEQVAGFQDLKTGKFDDVALIRNPADLQAFLDAYGLKDIEKIY
ncbi:MAG: aspartate dehydrogenase [Lachnospiraceae bacterium]|nr:aspartate dehydrogenase [Lachnospiraceae bacterium]